MQFFLASGDRYFTKQLFTQLDLLPEWAIIASKRVGQAGGPLTSEFELSEQELDW